MRPDESFVEQPVRSLQSMLRVIAEYDDSYKSVVPDGIYGPDTMNAVSVIQRRNMLPVTGVVDQQTWEQIVSLYETAIIITGKAEPIEILIDPGQVFRAGSSGPYIYLLQSMLVQLSKDHPMINAPDHTGFMDDETISSIASFQKLAGLPITGELDKITWKNVVLQFALNAHHNANRRPNTDY